MNLANKKPKREREERGKRSKQSAKRRKMITSTIGIKTTQTQR